MSSKLFQVQKIVVLLLAFFCASVLCTDGIDLTKHEAGPEKHTWVGYKKYDPPLDHEGLTREAQATYARLKGTVPKKELPGVVTAMSTGDGHTYFASSAKGPGGLHPGTVHPDIDAASKACGKEHRTGGNCGETMVIPSWYRANPGKSLKDEHSKSIVAVTNSGVVNPCTHQASDVRGDHGCSDFLKHMGFKDHEIVLKAPACDLTKRGLGGKACAMKPGAKSVTPGKQAPKKATMTPGKQSTAGSRNPAAKKATTGPRNPASKKTTTGARNPASMKTTTGARNPASKKTTAGPRNPASKKTTAGPRNPASKKTTAGPRNPASKKATAGPRIPASKKATAGPRNPTSKMAAAGPRNQAPKKATAGPRNQAPNRATSPPRNQAPKTVTASPAKQPQKKATATPRQQPLQKPSIARKHRRSMY